MKFTGHQLAAIFRLGHAMADADGTIEDEETQVIISELARFGLDEDEVGAVIDAGADLTGTEAMSVVSEMTDEQKAYVAAYLGVIMANDGDIDDNELKLWRFVCTVCDCPEMTIEQAFELLNDL